MSSQLDQDNNFINPTQVYIENIDSILPKARYPIALSTITSGSKEDYNHWFWFYNEYHKSAVPYEGDYSISGSPVNSVEYFQSYSVTSTYNKEKKYYSRPFYFRAYPTNTTIWMTGN
jgi:hypothetical protein